MIAAAFNQDPVRMLTGTWFQWHLRVACSEIYAEAMKPPSK